jgi:F-type H+-transporting ATPase subunit delta
LPEQDTTVSGFAERYAAAAFDLASEANAVEAVEADLVRFSALLEESADLKRLVESPVFRADQQLAGLTAVIDRAGIGGIAANFLKFVASNRRLFAVAEMIRGFRAMAAEARGETVAEVTSAEPLSEAHAAALTEALQAATSGRTVKLSRRVDPALIGGLVVKLGSRMIDTSIRTKLNYLRVAMKEVG